MANDRLASRADVLRGSSRVPAPRTANDRPALINQHCYQGYAPRVVYSRVDLL